MNLLVDIVAKGGNLAINVGPRPNGVLPEEAMEHLKGMGKWLEKYGEAIYGTRACEPYKKDGIAFTRKKDTIYAIETFETDDSPVNSEVWIPCEEEITRIIFMESGEELMFRHMEGGYLVTVPEYVGEKAPLGRVFCMYGDRG